MTQLNARHYATGQTVFLEADTHIFSACVPQPSADDGLWVAPGLIDIQINGFGGIDFNAPDICPSQIAEIVRRQWSFGVTGICPTIVTNAQTRMLHSLRQISEACRDPLLDGSIPGIHIEGPYISPVDGPRGAHPLEHVRLPDWGEFLECQDAAEGRIVLMTLAPEVEGAIPFIERLVDAGVTVSIGHTNAEANDIDAAVNAGAKFSTHLGNAAHAMIRRHPNYIWEQLARDELMASMILDGHHLPPPVAKCMVRCKGHDRVILVSDAVAFAGMPTGHYEAWGQSVDVTSDGRICLAGTPYLAGSGANLASCVANAVQFTDLSLAQAIDAATVHPARLLGIADTLGSLDVGRRANLILFEWDGQHLNVRCTLVAGEVVYEVARD